MSGALYVVATPIGNLEDITLRALRVLREADLVACEDTRHTSKLLKHFGIDKPTISYHEHNEDRRADELLDRIRAGARIALVTDGGTPLISDPGYRVVARAVEAGIEVIPVPGVAAVLAALSAAGLPTDAFLFAGFLPAKAGQRRKALEELKDSRATLVFHEAPHRVIESLEDIERVLGNRRVVVARELTKIHEEFLRGPVREVRQALAARPAVKGEITLLVEKGLPAAPSTDTLRPAVEEAIRAGTPRMEAIKQEARRRGISKREAYRMLESE